MKKIRVWAFPAGLLLAWLVASVYTLSSLVDANAEHRRLLGPAVVGSPHT
jgi:hypothetical protein